MADDARNAVLQELRRIPGVGKRISEDLWNLGIRSISDLKERSPEELYARLCVFQGTQVDRCMLYVLRCAVYYRQSGMFVTWLRRLDQERFRSFLLVIEDGGEFDESFSKVFGQSLDTVWQRFVSQL